MPASLTSIVASRWSSRFLLLALQCLLAAAADATMRIGVVLPGYDSTENAELSESILAAATWARREGLLDGLAREPIELTVLSDGCRPGGVSATIARLSAADTQLAIVGDCGPRTAAIASAYARQDTPFVAPFAQDVEGGPPADGDMAQIEPDGTQAARRLVAQMQEDGLRLWGRVLVLSEDNDFARAFFRGLRDDTLCASGCDLVTAPWPGTDTSRIARADWVVYAGRHVAPLVEVLPETRPVQRWLIYHRGRTPTRNWLGFLKDIANAPQPFRLIAPEPDSVGFTRRELPSANAVYFLAAVQHAAQRLAQQSRRAGAGGVFSGLGGLFGGLKNRVPAPPRAPALAAYSPGEFLDGVIGAGDYLEARTESAPPVVDIPATVEPVIVPPPPSPAPGVVGPPRAADRLPVYNLEIAPLESRSPLALKARTQTTLTFSLGPESEASVLGNATVNPEVESLAAGDTLTLGVTMNCLVCARGTYQRGFLEYDPTQGRSLDPAVFEIVADARRADPESGEGLILFTVDAGGVDLDVIQVAVFVGQASAEQARAWEPPAVRQVRHGTVIDEDAPDLVIDVAAAAGALPVTLIPHLPELATAMERTLGPSRDGAWQYEAGVTKSDLDGLVRNAYVELRGMIEQHDALKSYFAGLGRESTLSPGAARLDLSDGDRRTMLAPLQTHGARIYNRVFMRGSRGLRDGIRLVDEFRAPGERPLRILFRVSNLYAPWQLLYPGARQTVDVERFWGFRHELATRQLVDAAQATLLTTMDKPSAAQTLFAAYRSDSQDNVAARARLFASNVDALLPDDLDVADSREEFLSRLSRDGPRLRLIIAYGHATSGTVIGAGAGGTPIMAADAGSARFVFAEREYLVPDDIDDYAPPPDVGLLLEGQPLVIFNACETGGGGLRAMNNNGFVGALTRAGARAVVVTETPVWNNFAYHFAGDVFKGLMDGRPVSAALRDARLRHLREWGNPLGLIYTLYGNPSARME